MAGRGVCVCEHTAGASAQDVGAVIPTVAAGGGTTLTGDVIKDGCDGVLGGGPGGLEVFGHLGVVGSGVRSCGAGERCTVGERGGGCGAAGAGAARLDDGALGEVDVVTANLAGLLAVDVGLDPVADVGNRTSDLGRIQVGVSESTLRDSFEVTTSAQVVSNGDVEGCLDCLAGSDDLESRLVKVAGADAEADAIEGDLLLGLEGLDLLDVRVIKESTGLEDLEVPGSGVPDQGLDCGVTGELEFNIER